MLILAIEMLTLILALLPWIIGAYFLFPNALQNIFSKVKELYHNAYVERENTRRQALLDEMKRLGYDRENMTHEDVDKLEELLRQEFPVLYK